MRKTTSRGRTALGRRAGGMLLAAALLLQLGIPAVAAVQEPSGGGEAGLTASAQVAGLTVQSGYAQVKLAWTASEGAESYAVYRGTSEVEANDASTPLTGAEALTETAYTDTAADTGTQYWYRVDAVGTDSTAKGAAVQADLPTGAEAFRQNAVVNYVFEGEERQFDGSRVVDQTADLDKVKDLAGGTILVKYRYDNKGAARYVPLVILGGAEAKEVKMVHYSIGSQGNYKGVHYANGKNATVTATDAHKDMDYTAWHTGALTSGGGQMKSTLDGTTDPGSLAAGFFADVASPTSFMIGGLTVNTPGVMANGKWSGEIAYVIVSDEALTDAQAAEITAADHADATAVLAGAEVTANVGAEVGAVTVTGADAGGAVPALVSGWADNGMFEMAGATLKVKTALTAGETYTVYIDPGVAGAEPSRFQITALEAPVDAPEITRAEAGYAQVKLAWKPVAGASAYSVYRGESQQAASGAVEALAGGLTGTAYTDAAASTGVRYWYRVDAMVNGEAVEGAAVQADMATGLDAFIAHARLYYRLEGEDRVFDGTKVLDKTADLDQVKSMTSGTILTQYRFSGQSADNANARYVPVVALGGTDAREVAMVHYSISNYYNGKQCVHYGSAKGAADAHVGMDYGTWHTGVLTSGEGAITSTLDGVKASEDTSMAAAGFFSDVVGANRLVIGGWPATAPGVLNSAKWVGEIAYVVISDEVLTDAQAAELTAAEQAKIPSVSLDNKSLAAGKPAGTEVGALTATGSGSPVLSLKAGAADNALFEIKEGKLLTAQVLEPGTYTVELLCSTGAGAGYTFTFTIRAFDTTLPFYPYDGTGSSYFRIPALLTLNNGDVMAAIDARYTGGGDSPANLDTAVNFRRAGESDWEIARVINHFQDYPDAAQGAGTSASYIDPAIVQLTRANRGGTDNTGRILMLVDAFPSGGGLTGSAANCLAGSGMVTVDGKRYLALTDGDYNDFSTFAYYIDDDGIVRNLNDKSATEYTVDGEYHLYKKGTPQYIAQNGTGEQVPSSVFYKESDLTVFRTCYLMVRYSDDNGRTWSGHLILNGLKEDNERFVGAGPGRGLQITKGEYAGRVLFCVYDNSTGAERASVLYSDDGGLTWARSARTEMGNPSPGKSSEAQLVELPNGTLRMFARSSSAYIGYADSFDGGATWTPFVQDKGLPYDAAASNGCQISVINYSQPIDGKPAIICSSPLDNRQRGSIRIGLISEDAAKPENSIERYTVDWRYQYQVNNTGEKYGYSCLTELPDHRIGLLYEGPPEGGAKGEIPLYKEFRLSELMAGANISLMFDNAKDNTWLFSGGRAAQGSFADIGGARNYVGQFEEYVRWTKSGTLMGRQRYVVNAAKTGQDAAAAAEGLKTWAAELKPRAAAYLVGREDWEKGAAGLEGFKAGLTSFIRQALALRDGSGFAVIQTPCAVRDPADNASAGRYAQAVAEVVATFTEAERIKIVVVDHFTQTDNASFKENCLNANGMPNAKGHLELGRQFCVATFGSADKYPNGNPAVPDTFPNDLNTLPGPEAYWNVPATVTAGRDSLAVTVPDGTGAADWKYVLETEGYTLTGTAAGSSFTIPNLPEGGAYTLVLTATDNSVRLPTVAGTVTDGAQAALPKKALTAPQQAIADKMASGEAMTWLFMGDSITHGAGWLYGYDAVAQSFEKFLKDDLGRLDDLVLNTAVSGATTRETVNNLNERLGAYQPDVVSIMLGTNDAAKFVVSVSDYKANLEQLLAAIEAKGAVAVLRTPTPTAAGNRGENLPEYVAAILEVAAKHPNAIVVDQFGLWEPLVMKDNIAHTTTYLFPLLFDKDGTKVHPGPRGHLWMTQQLIEELGLWREDSAICALRYDLSTATESSSVKPALTVADREISLSSVELEAGCGKALQSVTLTATDVAGRAYSRSGMKDTLGLAGLPLGTYTVQVSAQLLDQNSRVTFAGQQVTLAAATDTQAPTVPGGLQAAGIRGASAELTWTAATDNVGVTGYKVYLNGALLETVTGTAYLLTGLTPGTDYTAAVSAVDAAGNESAKADASFRTADLAVVSGRVLGHDGTPAGGVGVELRLGAAVVDAGRTGADGGYILEAPDGSYMLVATAPDGVTVTQVITLSGNQTADITLPEGKLNTAVRVEPSPEVPGILADGLDGLFSEEDQAHAGSGNGVTYTLEVAAANAGSEIEAIRNASAGQTLDVLLEITLRRAVQTGEGPAEESVVSHAAALVELFIPVNPEWQGQRLTVYRCHDGKVEAITETANAEGECFRLDGEWMRLSVRNFSTYAVAYGEKESPVVPDTTPTLPSVSRHSVRVEVEGAGTATPDTAMVQNGDSVTITLKPDRGHKLGRLLLDGRVVSARGPDTDGAYAYTLKQVEADHVFKAVFMDAADDVLAPFTDLNGHWARASIRALVENGLMSGTGADTFSPEAGTSRAMVVTTLYRMAGAPAAAGKADFTDVPEGAWYAEAVAWAVEKDIAQGVGGGCFAPEREITRQEVAVFFLRYARQAGLDTAADQAALASYADGCAVAGWAAEAVAWCVDKGIFSGGGQLLPAAPATRGELAVMLVRLLEATTR